MAEQPEDLVIFDASHALYRCHTLLQRIRRCLWSGFTAYCYMHRRSHEAVADVGLRSEQLADAFHSLRWDNHFMFGFGSNLSSDAFAEDGFANFRAANGALVVSAMALLDDYIGAHIIPLMNRESGYLGFRNSAMLGHPATDRMMFIQLLGCDILRQSTHRPTIDALLRADVYRLIRNHLTHQPFGPLPGLKDAGHIRAWQEELNRVLRRTSWASQQDVETALYGVIGQIDELRSLLVTRLGMELPTEVVCAVTLFDDLERLTIQLDEAAGKQGTLPRTIRLRANTVRDDERVVKR